MTQQPYPYQPPAQPGYPAPQQYAPPAAPAPVYAPPAPQQYAPPAQPGYPQGYAPQAPQQHQGPVGATGSIDEFYAQPSTGGGKGISWKGKPDGTSYIGVVARDVSSADIQQDSDPMTKQLKFYRDGRPQFAMAVPLVLNHPDFPEGEARLFVRGQLRDELTRAMAAVGVTGAPKGGDTLQVTLTHRKQGSGAVPQNIFAVVYTPAGGAPATQPAAQAPAQPVAQPGAPAQQYAAPAAPAPQAPAAAVAPQGAPAPQAQLAAPAGLAPEQVALLAQMTGQQPAQA